MSRVGSDPVGLGLVGWDSIQALTDLVDPGGGQTLTGVCPVRFEIKTFHESGAVLSGGFHAQGRSGRRSSS